MSEQPTISFSVARFAIEGVGEEMKRAPLAQFVSPRLSDSRTSIDPSLSFDLLSAFDIPAYDYPNPRQTSHNDCTNSQHDSLVTLHSPISTVFSPFPDAFSLEPQDSIPISSSTVSFHDPINLSNLRTPKIVPELPAHSLPTPSQFTPLPSTYAANSVAVPARKSRKVPADRVIAPSPYRPHVSAPDRIFSWRTPYALSHDTTLLAELPPALVESAKMSITGALAASTRSTYASGILRFNQFCDKWNISENSRMPASYGLLCAFIGEHKGSVSGRTVRSWLSGIRAWHLANHAQWFGDDKWVQMARTSANKEGAHHKRSLRAPVSIEHLLALRRAVSLSLPFHASVWAVALVSFFGCRRLGETTVPSSSAFDHRYHAPRSTV